MTTWREVARVAAYLDAHRSALRPLVEVRCPLPPSPTLGAVYLLEGERWLWSVGVRFTPAELDAEGLDPVEWPKVAASVRPLDRGWTVAASIQSCRKCRRSYSLDVPELDRLTRTLPAETIKRMATHRVSVPPSG